MRRFALAMLAILGGAASATAQDVRGLEVCTAEKTMERRTSCLQSNVEFLQQALTKQKRELQTGLDALRRESDAQKAELSVLKAALAKVENELAELKKPKPDKK